MHTSRFVYVLLAIFPSALFSQPLQLEWVIEYPCYGSSGLEYDRVITDDTQNVYLCGAARSPTMNSFYSSAILTQKYDSTGTLVWESFFDGKFSDSFYDCAFVGDDGFIVGGYRGTLPTALPQRAEIAKYDTGTGAELWHNFIFDTITQGAYMSDFDIDEENNIYAFGAVNSYLGQYDSNKMYVAKILHTTGETAWKRIFQDEFSAYKGKLLSDRIRIYGGKSLGQFNFITILMDIGLNGNIISVANLPNIDYGPGIFESYFFFDNQGYFISFGYNINKFNVSATPEWAFDFSRGLPHTIGQAKTATHDAAGNIYATGYIRDTVNHKEFTQTIKLSPDGELLWATVDTFDQGADYKPGEVIAISDHHVFTCSEIWYYNDENEVEEIDYRPILYSNDSGEALYDTLIDGNQFDITYDAHYGKGHFYLLGRSYKPGGTADDYRYKLFKFKVEEPSGVSFSLKGEEVLSIFPNPFDASATIELKGIEPGKSLTFKLLDVTGRLVQQRAFRSPSFVFHRENLPSGLYFIKVETADGRPVAVGRVVAK
jgi:Secretion system C-terminal sorting domain